MGKLAKSLKNSIWYASKILNGTRYAEQNWEVRGTPWGEGVIASSFQDGNYVVVLSVIDLWFL